MDISLIIKIAGVGILVAVAYILLSRSGREEMAMLVSLGGVIIVLILLVEQIARLFDLIKSTFGI